jgi:hypothetical protein
MIPPPREEDLTQRSRRRKEHREHREEKSAEGTEKKKAKRTQRRALEFCTVLSDSGSSPVSSVFFSVLSVLNPRFFAW